MYQWFSGKTGYVRTSTEHYGERIHCPISYTSPAPHPRPESLSRVPHENGRLRHSALRSSVPPSDYVNWKFVGKVLRLDFIFLGRECCKWSIVIIAFPDPVERCSASSAPRTAQADSLGIINNRRILLHQEICNRDYPSKLVAFRSSYSLRQIL
jgi:hypothetical protein